MSFNNANLTDSFNHFKGFFEFATMGILVIDSDGNISAINPFAQKQFGYEEEEILGKNIEIIIPHNFYIRPGQQEKIKKNLKVVGGKNELNLYNIKKNGSHFPVDARVCHYPNHGGLYTVVFIADVSQNKTSESELEQLNFDLENTVTNRTRDLQEAMQQLEKSNDRLEKVLIFQKTLYYSFLRVARSLKPFHLIVQNLINPYLIPVNMSLAFFTMQTKTGVGIRANSLKEENSLN